MAVNCQIFIERPREGVHKAGDPVRGTIRYHIYELTEYKEIILSLIGKAECSWYERRPHLGPQHEKPHIEKHKVYRGAEVFVNQTINILQGNPGSTVVLQRGIYERSFEFRLPTDIPPSFRDSTCTIEYKIQLQFEKPSFFSHTMFTTVLDVYGYVKPVGTQGRALFGLEKTLLRPFSKRNHIIKLKGDTSNTIFTPGENAIFALTVTNDTDITITSVKTELICITTYTASCGRIRNEQKAIRESAVETPSVPPDAVANMSNTVPILAHLYSIQHCGIIKKEYKAKVTLRLPMPYINASIEIPIAIGEKRDDEVTFNVNIPGPSREAVATRRVEALPSYWEAMNEDKGEND